MIPHAATSGPLVIPGMPAGADDLPPLVWEPFRDGVAVSWLYRTGPAGPAAAFLRLLPGARLVADAQAGYEHVHVLEGSQEGPGGLHTAGTLVVHPPGTPHTVSSEEGCLLFIVWERFADGPPAAPLAVPTGAPLRLAG